VVKGGLIIDLGVRGFLPASLVDIRRVHDLEEFRGQELRCKVIELNRSRNNVVLSRRAVLEEERREVRQRILDDLEPGKVVEGVISNIVDFGAFVDLDGIDGLIHISELSWSHVNHPSEILEIGQRVRVKVLDIDRDRQRISLGLKQTQADPWQRVLESYGQDDVVWGRVTKVVTFGAFVEILQGVEGLVHISELAAHHVENPREVVSQGDIVKAKIIDIDAERRRLSLSMKRVLEDEDAQPPIALVPGDAPFLTPPSGDEPGRAEPYTGSTELTEEEEQAQAHELGLSADVFSDEAPAAADGELDEPEPALAAAEDDDVLKLSTELNDEIEDVETVYVAEAVEVEPEAEVGEEADRAEEPVVEVTEDEPVAEVTEDDPVVLEAEAAADAEDEAQVETEAEAHADDDDAAERR
jgi:small subunit ribosomal protein S1